MDYQRINVLLVDQWILNLGRHFNSNKIKCKDLACFDGHTSLQGTDIIKE